MGYGPPIMDDEKLAQTVKNEYAGSDDQVTLLDSIEETPTGKFIWLVAFCASIAGALFGYDTGIISAVLVYLGDSLGHELAANEKELITSLASGGAFVGAIIAGLTADKYGRKAAIYLEYVSSPLKYIGA